MRVGFWNSFSYFYENRLSVFYHAFYYQTLAKIQNFRNFGFRSIPFDSRSFKIRYDYSWLNTTRIRHFKMTQFITQNRTAVDVTTKSHVRLKESDCEGLNIRTVESVLESLHTVGPVRWWAFRQYLRDRTHWIKISRSNFIFINVYWK